VPGPFWREPAGPKTVGRRFLVYGGLPRDRGVQSGGRFVARKDKRWPRQELLEGAKRSLPRTVIPRKS